MRRSWRLQYNPDSHQDPLDPFNSNLVPEYSHAELEEGPPDDDRSKNFEHDSAINGQRMEHYSPAARDLHMFAEWLHELKAAYTADEFVNRIRTGEQIPNFRVTGGIVYYRRPDQRVGVMYVPPEAVKLQHKIIGEFHDTAVAGHLSAAKILERLKRLFYWP